MTNNVNVADTAGASSSTPLKIPKKKAALDARKARAGYMFVLPFILGVILLYLPILLDSIWFSMSRENKSNPFNVPKSVFASELGNGLKLYTGTSPKDGQYGSIIPVSLFKSLVSM